MTESVNGVVAGVHGIISDLAQKQCKPYDDTALRILLGAPGALLRAHQGEYHDANAIDAILSGSPASAHDLSNHRIAVSTDADPVRRSIGLFQTLIHQLCLGGSLVEKGRVTQDGLVLTIESMLSPLLLSLHGANHAHRVEYALLAAGEADRLPHSWVQLELLAWGRTTGSVLADFNLGRLLGWIRSGRLVNTGVSDHLTNTEVAAIQKYGADLHRRPISWFGSRVTILDDLGLTEGLSSPQREILNILHGDGWEGSAGDLIAAVRLL